MDIEQEESRAAAAAALSNSSQLALLALAENVSMFVARRRLVALIAGAKQPPAYHPGRHGSPVAANESGVERVPIARSMAASGPVIADIFGPPTGQ
jgi:hypothetical protein